MAPPPAAEKGDLCSLSPCPCRNARNCQLPTRGRAHRGPGWTPRKPPTLRPALLLGFPHQRVAAVCPEKAAQGGPPCPLTRCPAAPAPAPSPASVLLSSASAAAGRAQKTHSSDRSPPEQSAHGPASGVALLGGLTGETRPLSCRRPAQASVYRSVCSLVLLMVTRRPLMHTFAAPLARGMALPARGPLSLLSGREGTLTHVSEDQKLYGAGPRLGEREGVLIQSVGWSTAGSQGQRPLKPED